ncbi:MAG: hypothetical protein IJO48_01640 [Clostridia bacterium]|nr:hypothetical protein [Clostridia bacterium]
MLRQLPKSVILLFIAVAVLFICVSILALHLSYSDIPSYGDSSVLITASPQP